MEHVDHLSQQSDSSEQGNPGTGEASGLPLPVPVLVEIENAGRDGFGKPHLPHDVRTAMTAGLDQFAADLLPLGQSDDHGPESLGEIGLQPGMLEDETKHLRQAVIDDLDVALERDVVGQKQLADARGIAAAADILEQERVIEIAHLAVGQAEFLPDIHSNPTATDAVAFRLAFGQVERVAQCTDQFSLGKLTSIRLYREIHQGSPRSPR